jgi:F420-non-reducing hydrogenase large subunit
MSVEKAAKGLIHKGIVTDGLLNMIEMSFRAYDPCNGCATHLLPGDVPITVQVKNRSGEILSVIRR